jgi:TonB family protein
MRQYLPLARLLVLALWVPVLGSNLTAQSPATAEAPKTEPELAKLTAKLGEELRQAGAKRVVVLDLRPSDQPSNGRLKDGNPIGKGLADQIAATLRTSTPELQSIGRLSEENDAKTYTPVADAVVVGTFARVAQRLEISLTANPKDTTGAPIAPVVQEIAISPELAALNAGSIPEKVVRAGVKGVSSPACIHCPMPEYSDEARRKSISGSVALDVAVTTEGTLTNIVVKRSLGYGLDEKAIEAVKWWRLTPCAVDGRPVQCRVVIEVGFRTFRNR